MHNARRFHVKIQQIRLRKRKMCWSVLFSGPCSSSSHHTVALDLFLLHPLPSSPAVNVTAFGAKSHCCRSALFLFHAAPGSTYFISAPLSIGISFKSVWIGARATSPTEGTCLSGSDHRCYCRTTTTANISWWSLIYFRSPLALHFKINCPLIQFGGPFLF